MPTAVTVSVDVRDRWGHLNRDFHGNAYPCRSATFVCSVRLAKPTMMATAAAAPIHTRRFFMMFVYMAYLTNLEMDGYVFRLSVDCSRRAGELHVGDQVIVDML